MKNAPACPTGGSDFAKVSSEPRRSPKRQAGARPQEGPIQARAVGVVPHGTEALEPSFPTIQGAGCTKPAP